MLPPCVFHVSYIQWVVRSARLLVPATLKIFMDQLQIKFYCLCFLPHTASMDGLYSMKVKRVEGIAHMSHTDLV